MSPTLIRPPLARITRFAVLSLAALAGVFGTQALSEDLTATLEPGSTVTYHARDPRGSFEGHAMIEALELRFDPAAPRTARLRVVVRPERFDSGNLLRDVNARRTVFETERYPEASFVLKRAEGPPVPEVGVIRLRLIGDLTLHGVTREVTVPVVLERDGATLIATGDLTLRLSEYGMRRPSFLVWTVEDEVIVRFALTLRLSGDASAAPTNAGG